jgi:hypothetical protein
MKIADWLSCILLAVVLIGILRAIIDSENGFPYLKRFNDETKHAYLSLTFAAFVLLAWAHLDLHIDSVEFAGVKASVHTLQTQVNTLTEQMEVFFKSKKIEVFDAHNWNRVHLVKKTKDGIVLEVTLEQEPIPGSVEVYDGVLLMPETEYKLDGKRIQFPADADTPVDGLTIKYYPRVPPKG